MINSRLDKHEGENECEWQELIFELTRVHKQASVFVNGFSAYRL